MRTTSRLNRSALTGAVLAAALSASAVAPAVAAGPLQGGQAVEVREGDSWSAATVVRREGRRYLIHYAGTDASTDEWVGPDRVRTPGGTAGAPVPASAAPSKAADPAATAGEPVEADRSAIDVSEAVDPPPSWSVKPDPAAKPESAPQAWGLHPPQRTQDHPEVKHLLPCGGGGAVVGSADFFDKQGSLDRIGTTAGAAHAVLPPALAPVAASPSGAVVLCHDSGFGRFEQAQLHVLSLTSSGVRPVVTFAPYPSSDHDGKGTNVEYAAALSDTKVVTCDGAGELIAWAVGPGSAKGVWRADVGRIGANAWGTDIVVSPGGKWLAVASHDGLTFVDPATGHVLGIIPADDGSAGLTDLACSPTGKTLVGRAGMDNLVSFDVATGQRLRTVALPAKTWGTLACPDDGFALVGAGVLIDVNTGGVVPHFKSPLPGASLAATGAGVTLLASASRLAAVHLVDAATRKAAAAAAEDALALKPGMPVQLDLQLDLSDADQADVEAALRKRLKADGFEIAATAPTVIVCRTEAGPQHEYHYAKSQAGFPVMFTPGGGESMILTDKITRLTIQQAGQTIWERKRDSGPAPSFPIKDGESLEDGAKATIKYDPQFLIDAAIPAYIAKGGGPAETPTTPGQPTIPRHRRVRP